LIEAGMCSYFGPMAQPIDTIGKAVRRGMFVKATCRRCGSFRCYKASDLMMVFGGGRDPLTLNFRCGQCQHGIDVTLIDVDLDRMRSATVYEPFWMGGNVVAWMATRLR
jgi:hypothetical protein